MHSAPSNEEKLLYLDSGRRSLYGFGFISMIFLMAGNILFIYFNPVFWAYAIFIAITIFYLSLSYLVGFCGKPFDYKKHKQLVYRWLDWCESASVDIYLPVCGEPVDVIFNTWTHVKELVMGHDNLKVYVLDDGKSDVLKDLASKFKFNYIRRETNELKKAGNLRNAFKQTDGEFILILDADFAPRKDFLIETLPYMFEHHKCGIVGTPQFFNVIHHNRWIGKGAAAVQELFYRLIQVSRDTFNASVCTGTNTLYRRSALEPHGGTAAIAYSEDCRTGFRLIVDGWRIYYLPINLCLGICPDDLKSFFVQQYRWAMGSISIAFSKEFWVAKISIMQRISYMTGFLYYVSTGLSVIFAPLPGIVMLAFYPEKISYYNLLFSVPSLIFGYIFFAWWLKARFGLYIQQSRQVSYFSHLYAIRDYLFNTLESWIPTGDTHARSNRYESFKIAFVLLSIVPQALMLILLLGRLIQGYSPVNFILVFVFMILNAAISWPILKSVLRS